MKALFVSICGILIGIIMSALVIAYSPNTLLRIKSFFYRTPARSVTKTKQIIGFLPYFLVGKAQDDYSNYISTLTYFGLTVSPDGTIQKLANEQEEEPGWFTLRSKDLQRKLSIARNNNQALSLLVFSGDADQINTLTSDPVVHGRNLVNDVAPIMKKYGFSDLNLDLENTKNASDEARANFTTFTKAVKSELDKRNAGTLTVEVTGNDFIKKGAINPEEVGKIADYIVIMAYDFHYPSSRVTGPVAPIGGGGEDAEFDTRIVLDQAYAKVPREKIVLGIPSYGYSWETIADSPKSAVIPGSGVTLSNRSVEKLLGSCATCSAQLDEHANEKYIVYKDPETGTYHQIFYPEKDATQKKADIAKNEGLGGLAVWALGYENINMLSPLAGYKSQEVDLTHL